MLFFFFVISFLFRFTCIFFKTIMVLIYFEGRCLQKSHTQHNKNLVGKIITKKNVGKYLNLHKNTKIDTITMYEFVLDLKSTGWQ